MGFFKILQDFLEEFRSIPVDSGKAARRGGGKKSKSLSGFGQECRRQPFKLLKSDPSSSIHRLNKSTWKSSKFAYVHYVHDSFPFFPILQDSFRFFKILQDSFRFFKILSDSLGFFKILSDSLGFDQIVLGFFQDSFRILRILGRL